MRLPLIDRRTAVAAVSAVSAVALSTAVAGPAHAAETAPPAKTSTVAVVLVGFTDSKLEDPAKSAADYQDIFFGASASVDSYYRSVSQGARKFAPADTAKPVLGPVTLPMTAAGCDYQKMKAETYKALTAQGVDAETADHVSIVFPNDKAGCEWGGLGTVGGGNGGFTWIPDGAGVNAVAHEIGHNLGYSHHMRTECEPGTLRDCKENSTTGRTVMGGGGTAAGLTAPELLKHDWLTAGQRAAVTKSGTYTLKPLYGTESGVKALEVPLSATEKIIVELRRPAGTLDKELNGVFAYKVTDGAYGKSVGVDLRDAKGLQVGVPLADDAAKLKITVTAARPDAATVAVSLDGAAVPASQATAGPKTAAGAAAGAKATPAAGGTPEDEKAHVTIAPKNASPRVPASAAPSSAGPALATTGGDGGVPLPLAGGAAGLLLLGLVATAVARKRRQSAGLPR